MFLSFRTGPGNEAKCVDGEVGLMADKVILLCISQ